MTIVDIYIFMLYYGFVGRAESIGLYSLTKTIRSGNRNFNPFIKYIFAHYPISNWFRFQSLKSKTDQVISIHFDFIYLNRFQ